MTPKELEILLDELYNYQQKKNFLIKQWRVFDMVAGRDEKFKRGVNRFFRHQIKLAEAQINDLEGLIHDNTDHKTFYAVLEDSKYYDDDEY